MPRSKTGLDRFEEETLSSYFFGTQLKTAQVVLTFMKNGEVRTITKTVHLIDKSFMDRTGRKIIGLILTGAVFYKTFPLILGIYIPLSFAALLYTELSYSHDRAAILVQEAIKGIDFDHLVFDSLLSFEVKLKTREIGIWKDTISHNVCTITDPEDISGLFRHMMAPEAAA